MTGRVPSALSKARFTERSRIVLFHVGSSWPTSELRAANGRRIDGRRGSTSSASGSLCPHHTAIDGWWPSRSTASRPWRTACLRMLRAYPHCNGKSCHSEQPGLVGGVVELGPADVGVDAHEVEAGVVGERDVARDLVRRRLGRAPCGSGPGSPLEEQPLAVDRTDPVAHRHLAEPDAHAPGGRWLELVGERHLDRRRRAAAGRRARAATTASGSSTLKVHSTWFSPAASGCSTRRSTSPTVVRRSSTVARLGGVEHGAERDDRARRSSASRHSARADARMRTGPVRSMRTGRQMPPGFQSGSRQSQCWNTPVMLRLAVRSARSAQSTSTREQVLGRRRRGLGHLELVGEEVALGVAEVARRPARRRPGRRRRRARASSAARRAPVRRGRSGCGRAAARRSSANAGVERQCPGTAMGSQPASSKSARARCGAARRRRPAPATSRTAPWPRDATGPRRGSPAHGPGA